jgi:uncharacterized protein (TIGR02996 family)
MAFEGDLTKMSLGDVLQAICLSRQLGTFIVRSRDDERRLACSDKGIALASDRTSFGVRLGTMLVGMGKVSPEHLEEALRVQRRRRDERIGGLLIESGACTEDDVRAARRYIASEEIFALFEWTDAQFDFQDGEPDLSGVFADIWFDVASIAMESARRMDEMPRLLAAVPLNEVFIADGGRDPVGEECLENRDIARLYRLCDGDRTVLDIVESFHRGRFDTLKGLQTLVEAGLLRPAEADEVAKAGRGAKAAGDFLRGARLLQRAVMHYPEDDLIRLAMAECLRDSGQKQPAADELVRVGVARLTGGNAMPAVESFRAAIKLDDSNVAAYEGLADALAREGLVDEAADAALSAGRLKLSHDDFEGAVRAAEKGLAQRADDAQLLVLLANAYHGLNRTPEALQILDDVVRRIESTGQDRHRLVDVYRRIMQIDPDRRDCARRVAEIQAWHANRKRRIATRVAAVVGVVVLAVVALPFLSGPSVSARLVKARELLDENDAEQAKEVLLALGSVTLNQDQILEKRGLDERLDALLNPPQNVAARDKFDARSAEICRTAVDAILEERVTEGMGKMIELLDYLEGPDSRKIASFDEETFQKLRTQRLAEVATGLGHGATVTQAVAAKVGGVCARYTDDVWKREDLDVLHDLISSSARILESTKAEDWDQLPALVAQVVRRTRVPKDQSDKTMSELSVSIAQDYRDIARDYERALVRARRKEVKEGYKSAYANGMQLERDGRIEEALAQYETFLTQCEDLRRATPAELYAPVVTELLSGEMQLDQRVRASRDRLSAIARESDRAQQAEAADDVETAFRIRRQLVRDNPDLELTRRFQMPVRIESAPPGALVTLMDGSPAGRPIGRTPLVTSYPVAGGAKYRLTLDGYGPLDVVRQGADKDDSGVHRVELPKIAVWTSGPAGMTESPPAIDGDWVVTASRAGVVRRLAAKDGTEAARFDAGLLDGFCAPPVIFGGKVFAAALDGKGFVLDPVTLARVATFETGPVRAAPVSTPAGVVVADESGTMRLIGPSGAASWTKPHGRVRCDLALSGTRVLALTTDAELLLIEPATGDVSRRHQLSHDFTWSPPTVQGERLFIGNEAGEVVCLDASTLEPEWAQRLDGPVRGALCAAGRRVVACTSNGAVHVLDSENGMVLSRTLVGGRVDGGACALPDGGFVVATRKGYVTRFDSSAQIVWKFDAGDEIGASPWLSHGAVSVVTRKGVVIALSP